MPYGWMGTNLEVDLSRGEIEKVKGDPKLVEDYLGGGGTNVKTLWDRVPPEVDAFSPDNLLIVGAGLLCGTIVPSANRTVITYKSPLTDIFACSSMGGFFAPELKFAGYDTIVISGKSPTPVYLWINDDHVELHDASHLWGKDTRETQRLIREELKEDKAQIMCIGQAGENRVYVASIEHSTGVSASRAGVGAVMGDKKLKAIAVYGTKDVNIAKPARLIELCEPILTRTGPLRSNFENYGPPYVDSFTRIACYGNFSGEPRSPELQEKIRNAKQMTQDFTDRCRVRQVACYNCGIRCKDTCILPNGEYSFVKCSAWCDAMEATKIIDSDFATAHYNLCEKYGLDLKSITCIITFAIDLYQRGILTKEDTDGMVLDWENPEVAFWLTEKIVRREGIGDVLANGVYRAARQIGRDAEKYAHHSKKMETDKVVMRGPHYALMEAASDRGDHARLNCMMFSVVWPHPKKEREEYIKQGFFIYPKEYEKYLLTDFDLIADNYEGLVQFTVYNEQAYAIADAAGLCAIWTVFIPEAPINSRPLTADLISSVTGMNINETELTKIARRITSVVRAYNLREGIRREDDRIAEIYYHIAPPESYWKPDHGRVSKWIRAPYWKPDRNKLNKYVDRFHELKGFNREGIPTRETLQELGLDDVRQELERRGILRLKK